MSRTLIRWSIAALLLSPATLLAQTTRKDALTTFLFGLKITGVSFGSTGEAFFHSVGGLKSETEVTDYQSGGANGGTQKIPGALHFGDITLKRLVNADASLAAWRKLVEDGNVQAARHPGTIVLYDKQNKEIARWNIQNAWPSRLSIELDPDTGDPVEVITLAVEGIRRQ